MAGNGPLVPVVFLRRLHACLTVAWLLLAVPAVLWWQSSIPFLVFVSVYANVASHFAAWQGARSEESNEGGQEEPGSTLAGSSIP